MSTTPHTEESTFRNYNAEQAHKYASHRPDYPPALYQYILDHHTSSGGGSGLVLDLGTGHGNVIRAFAPHFERAVGADLSPGMLELARTLTEEKGVRTRSGGAVRFVAGGAEVMEDVEGVGEGSVDLITAATAAHWFDMPRFWASAAKVLKPRGTVALWSLATVHPHPTQPHAAELEKIITHCDGEVLDPFMLPGNRTVRAGYTTLQLPSDLPNWHPGGNAFPESGFHRKDWNPKGECGVDEEFFAGTREMTPEALGKVWKTGSPVTRWRADEGNKQKIARGEIKDCVDEAVDEMKKLVGEGGKMHLGVWAALLMFKKAEVA